MNNSASLQNRVELWRLLVYIGIFGLAFGIIIGRLFFLQVLDRERWIAKAAENSTETFNIAALRGVIYDRNDTILARNIASYNVVVTAAYLPDDPGAEQEIFRQLSTLINVPVNRGEISEADPYVPCISDHGIAQIAEYGTESLPYQAVKIKCDIDQRTAMILQEKAVDWPGISVEIQPIRDYPTGSLTASLVGFLGPVPAAQEDYYKNQGLVPNRDKVGYAGLEMQYQDILAGQNGRQVSSIDVGGQVVRPDIEAPVSPVPGLNLHLTIDTRLQLAAQNILTTNFDMWKQRYNLDFHNGVIIAINPKTGEILAMVSWPTYENNRMARLIPAYYYDQLIKDPSNPLLNHAVGDQLPAGSVFKLVTGTGALNEGVVTPEQVIETPGKLEITEKYYQNDVGTSRDFVDWIYKDNPAGFGHLDFVHGLANSSNVYFYKLGGGYKDEVPRGLGICRLGQYAKALGYGDAPGIGLPDEEKGLIPDPKWKRVTHAQSWSTGDTYITSVGQGYVLATPIQVLLSATILANDGKYMWPTLVREVTDSEGNVVPMYLDSRDNVTSTVTTRPLSPFNPTLKWDITDANHPLIQEYGDATLRGCEPLLDSNNQNIYKSVAPWVIQKVKEGMRLAVTEGTLKSIFDGSTIAASGKTGTAEYCDKWADAAGRCIPGRWPAHAWTVAFAPYDNPEIAVVAYVYNGNEGSTVAGPMVREVLEAYFQIKAIDNAAKTP